MPRRRVALVRKLSRRPKPKKPARKRKDPNDESKEPVNVWVYVRSSWIKALRFVPTGRAVKKRLVGYVDMWVYYKGRKYRYGTGKVIYLLQFKDWRKAASKGKYWWYRWTQSYSPAVRL